MAGHRAVVTLLHQDFLDLFDELNRAEARYLLVGGWAMNAHGVVRATEDLDVFLEASEENADRVLAALRAFGLPPGLPRELLVRPNGEPPTGFGFGRRPLRVDLLTSVQGVDFAECWPHRQGVDVGGVQAWLIARDDLVRAKRAAGRPKDIADLAALEDVQD